MKKKAQILIVVCLFIFLAGCSPKTDSPGEDFLQEAHDAVKSAYGDAYSPNMVIEDEFLKEIYGIDLDLVEEYIGEGPTMSTHVDVFIGIKAKPGEIGKIEEALNDYRDYLVNDSFQYPMNMAKVQASKVLIVEDYGFFLMLGDFNENMDATEEEALAFAQDQVQIAVDAIMDLVK